MSIKPISEKRAPSEGAGRALQSPAHSDKSRSKAPRGESPKVRSGEDSSAMVEPASLQNNIGFMIRQAQIAIYGDFFSTISDERITPARFAALHVIQSNAGLSQTELADALKVARSRVVKLVNILEGLQLIARHSIPTDRRSYALVLTPAGHAQLKKYQSLVSEHEDRVTSRLLPEERRVLLTLLRKLVEPGTSGQPK